MEGSACAELGLDLSSALTRHNVAGCAGLIALGMAFKVAVPCVFSMQKDISIMR